MRSEEFSGSTKWRDQSNGVWGCTTARKKLVQGEPAGASDVRYRVMGNESQPQKLHLELRMRSYRGPQGVLQKFYEYARTMTKKATGHPLPAAARTAFLSAGPPMIYGSLSSPSSQETISLRKEGNN